MPTTDPSLVQLAIALIGLLGAALSGVVLMVLKNHQTAQAEERQRNAEFREATRESIHRLRDEMHPMRTDLAVMKSRSEIAEVLRDGVERIVTAITRKAA